MKIQRALLSVSDKTGLVDFARALATAGVELLSTGGTARALRDAGLAVIDVSAYTGFPEMLDGRVKTLHPKVHGGILARRDLADHAATMTEHGMGYIDLVCVNLYPFVATVSQPHTLDDAIENIDIGGPAMVRSSAKNYRFVAIVTDPADYPLLASEMQAHGGALTETTRLRLAKKAFSHTAEYDGAISNYLTALNDSGEREAFGEKLNLQFTRAQTCRYGENPHQAGAFYVETHAPAGTIATARQLQGKELSYNNIADTDAALECIKQFGDGTGDAAPACVIVKHANPAAWPTARPCWRPTTAPTRPIPSRPSAASLPSTAGSTAPPPPPSSSASSSKSSSRPRSARKPWPPSPRRRTCACSNAENGAVQ